MPNYTPPPVPSDLRGTGKPDRLLRTFSVAARGYVAVTSRRRPSEPVARDRDLPLVVTDIRVEATDVVSLQLEAADGSQLPRWSPGAHLDVLLPSGKLRQYSLCGDPADRRHYRIAVRRIPDGGGGSVEIHDYLTIGTLITGRGPRNGFPFAYPHLARANIEQVVFIGAGIGITAILPMVRAAAAADVDWHLTYVGRDKESLPFLDEIGEFNSSRVDLRTGTRPDARSLLEHASPSASIYFCGPPGLLDAIRTELELRACAGFHFERFSPPPVTGGTAFDLRLHRTGHTVHVPENRPALAALREQLPDVPYSCQQGFCGTCRVRVLHGEVERRGSSPFLDEPNTMLICTDRARTPEITLDL
jgi:ferredoxin-NADP reductase